jgi:hypothetical protein
MKFVLSVRSPIAFNLVNKLLQSEESIPELQVRESNVQTVQQMEDAIEFYKADVYILDQQLEEYPSLKQVLEQYKCQVIEIENDVKAVLPIVREMFAEEEQEDESDQKGNKIVYELEQKPKVVYKDKIIEKEIIRTTYQAIPSKLIIVGSLYRGAGSTLLATNLARMIGERDIDVTYIEHPLIKPYMFDYLQMHTKEQPYYDIAREISFDGLARSIKREWKEHKVKWNVIDSREIPLQQFTYENLLVYLHSIQTNVTILDISDRWLDPDIQKILYLADSIYMCLESDPIKYDWAMFDHNGVNNSKEKMTLDFLKGDSRLNDFHLVNMKYIKSIDLKAWNEMINKTKKPIAKIPYIPYEDIQKGIYKSKLLYDLGYKDLIEKSLMPLLVKSIPKNMIEIGKKKHGFLEKVLKNR